MINHDKEFGFSFDGLEGIRAKHFNIDGSEAEHVNIWVEAYDDRRFWMAFIKPNPCYKFNLKTPDQAEGSDGKISNGCERLFSLEKSGDITLSKNNIFCLDSDDSFIKSCMPGYTCRKSPRNHVFFTNIYSAENAILELEHLDETFKNVTGQDLDRVSVRPSHLLLKLSEGISAAFVDAYFLEAASDCSELSAKLRKQLIDSVKSLSSLRIDEELESSVLFNEFNETVTSIHAEILKEIENLNKQTELSNFTKNIAHQGVNAKNMFLFINGHVLFDLITCIYQNVSDSIKKKEVARLKAVHPDSRQIVSSLHNGWPKFSESLKAGFFARKPRIPFLCETLERFSSEYAPV